LKFKFKTEQNRTNREEITFLDNSEEAKPVPVIRRERKCPNPRPKNQDFLNMSSSFSGEHKSTSRLKFK
jgi:hypothetical protein